MINFEDCFNAMREEFDKKFKDALRIDLKSRDRVYQKPYPANYDIVAIPIGCHVPEFVKFSMDEGKSTLEHVSQYLAHLGEAGSNDMLKVRYFSLSLTRTAFSWFCIAAC